MCVHEYYLKIADALLWFVFFFWDELHVPRTNVSIQLNLENRTSCLWHVLSAAPFVWSASCRPEKTTIVRKANIDPHMKELTSSEVCTSIRKSFVSEALELDFDPKHETNMK